MGVSKGFQPEYHSWNFEVLFYFLEFNLPYFQGAEPELSPSTVVKGDSSDSAPCREIPDVDKKLLSASSLSNFEEKNGYYQIT